MKVLITGGSGLIGKVLTQFLKDAGHDVAILTRKVNPKLKVKQYQWDPRVHEIDSEALFNVDCIIHLAGANIAEKRWTKKRWEEMYSSRVASAEFLFEKVKEDQIPLKSFISSSAIGWYGADTSEQVFTEEAACADDILGDLSLAWEAAADSFSDIGCSVSKVRTGIVLTHGGGALPKMMKPILFGMGSPIGSGMQYMPWIHMDDLCAIYKQLLEQKLPAGVYNGVSPEHVTNKDLTRLLAKVLQRPLWLPNVPSFVLSLIFGKMAVILLNGSRVSADKLIEKGFQFKYPKTLAALEDVLNK